MKLSTKTIETVRKMFQPDKSKDGIEIEELERGMAWRIIERGWNWQLFHKNEIIATIARTMCSDLPWWFEIKGNSKLNEDKALIVNLETAKGIVLQIVNSHSQIYRETLIRIINIGFFNDMNISEASVEMEKIKKIVDIIKPVLSEMLIETIDTGDGAIRVIHDESSYSPRG